MVRTMSIVGLSPAEKTALMNQLIEDKAVRTLAFMKNNEVCDVHQDQVGNYADLVLGIRNNVQRIMVNHEKVDNIIGEYVAPTKPVERHTENPDLS